jgi:hypothetical protein
MEEGLLSITSYMLIFPYGILKEGFNPSKTLKLEAAWLSGYRKRKLS